MLNTKVTKSLKAYSRKGVDSKSIRPTYDAVLTVNSIPVEHKLPFALMVANCFMNGGVPAGFRGKAKENKFIDIRTCKESFLRNPTVIVRSYKKTKPSTIERWSRAIVYVNEAFDPINPCL